MSAGPPKIKIPATSNPFVVTINNKTYSYEGGKEYYRSDVPLEVQALIEAIEAEKPTEAKMPGKVGQVVTRTKEGCAWEDAPTELPKFPEGADIGDTYYLSASKQRLIPFEFVKYQWEHKNPTPLPLPATTERSGTVKMSTAIEDATSETLLQQFNALLAAMRTAGQLDVSE